MNIVNHLPEDIWQDYIFQHPQSNIFHTPEMYKVFLSAQHHEPWLWAAIGKDSRPSVLFTPVQVSILSGPLQKLTSRSVAYGSILCQPGNQAQTALSALLRSYKKAAKKHVLFTETRNLSDLGEIQPILQGEGFTYADHLNYQIDLNCTEEHLMGRISKHTRKTIRRALKNEHISIEEINHGQKIKICYDLLKKTYSHAQTFLADQSLFDAAFNILFPKNMVKFLLVRYHDIYIAASVELLFNGTIYGWYNGMNRDYGRYNPNELLFWHILKWGIENGYQRYNFGCAGDPNQTYGVRNFIAKFKGDFFCFGRNTCVHSPNLMRCSQIGYRFYQKLLRYKSQRKNTKSTD